MNQEMTENKIDPRPIPKSIYFGGCAYGVPFLIGKTNETRMG